MPPPIRSKLHDGKLTGKVLGEIIGAHGKAEVLKKVRDELGLKREQVIAIGDGANDLKMMEEAGVSIAYRAKPIVQENATYAINHVGLDGVVIVRLSTPPDPGDSWGRSLIIS